MPGVDVQVALPAVAVPCRDDQPLDKPLNDPVTALSKRYVQRLLALQLVVLRAQGNEGVVEVA